MPLMLRMPEYGCEHISQASMAQIHNIQRSQPQKLEQDENIYFCMQCPTSSEILSMEKHVLENNHEFALSKKSIYCGECRDLVYEPIPPPPRTKKRKLSEVADDDDVLLAANTTQKPCGREGVRGLFNLGETCYMNAVLQMMLHNPLLSSYFLGSGHPIHTCPVSKEPEKKNDSDSDDDDSEPKPEHKMCVACSMTSLFAESRTVDLSIPAHAVDVLYASWKAIPGMSGKQQQDAHEWFMNIVDKLHETIKPTLDENGDCRCFFHKVFFGQCSSEVTCNGCASVTKNQEIYSSVSLDFKKQVRKRKKSLPPEIKTSVPTVQDCLKSYTTPEILSPEAYNCRNCGVPKSASKWLRFTKLPAILCVHVKRFGMKSVNGSFIEEKYGGKIDYPLTMNMALYTTNPHTKDKERFVYDLEAVVVHQGDHSHNGHYFAFCRQDDKWYRFDDEIVSATTTEDALRQEAYLLFYSLRWIGRPSQGSAGNGHAGKV